ncbi:MAG: TIGR03620 family F420-dependent LLM class oxidoreductase [Acidimicrobiales bacterium]
MDDLSSAGPSRVEIGRVGIWTSALDRQPAAMAREAAAELEQLGFPTLWVGEALRREAMSNSAMLLGATERMVVATGIANIWARDAMTMAAGQRTLAEAWPGRFLLGIGVSHAPLVDPRGHSYAKPYSAMLAYLDAMDAAPYQAPMPPEEPPRVLAALGPKMLALAAARSAGAHPYFVPVEHTAAARDLLGPGPLLCPEQAVVLEHDPAAARTIARAYMSAYLKLPNYTANLHRFGFSEQDTSGGGSDRLVDALIAWGGVERVAERVAEHHSAGADHVAVQVLVADPARLPMPEWRELAALVA